MDKNTDEIIREAAVLKNKIDEVTSNIDIANHNLRKLKSDFRTLKREYFRAGKREGLEKITEQKLEGIK